jgi:hypothetical protein
VEHVERRHLADATVLGRPDGRVHLLLADDELAAFDLLDGTHHIRELQARFGGSLMSMVWWPNSAQQGSSKVSPRSPNLGCWCHVKALHRRVVHLEDLVDDLRTHLRDTNREQPPTHMLP